MPDCERAAGGSSAAMPTTVDYRVVLGLSYPSLVKMRPGWHGLAELHSRLMQVK